MHAGDATKFAVALAKLFASRGGQAPSQVTREAYWEQLEDLRLEAVEFGMRNCARYASPMVPSAGEVRAEAKKWAPPARELPEKPVKPWTEAEAAEAKSLLAKAATARAEKLAADEAARRGWIRRAMDRAMGYLR